MKSQNQMKAGSRILLVTMLLASDAQASMKGLFDFSYKFRCPNGTYVISKKHANGRVLASISRSTSAIASPSHVFYGNDGGSISPDLIVNFNNLKKYDKKFDLGKFIPTDMPPTNNTQTIAYQVADRTMKSLFESVEFKQSSLGVAKATVEEKLKTEAVLGKTVNENKQVVEHKVTLNVQAFQKLAQFNYSGYTNASIKYFEESKKVALELKEKITTNQNILIGHTIEQTNKISSLGYQWNF